MTAKDIEKLIEQKCGLTEIFDIEIDNSKRLLLLPILIAISSDKKRQRRITTNIKTSRILFLEVFYFYIERRS